MEEQNCTELQWMVKGVKAAERLDSIATVSSCKFFLDWEQSTSWNLLLSISKGPRVLLQRTSTCTGPKMVEVDWDMRLITTDGVRWGNKGKGRKLFLLRDQSGWVPLCTLQEFLDPESSLVHRDALRLSVRIWPSVRQPVVPATLYANSKAGRSRDVNWAVLSFSNFKEGEEEEKVLRRFGESCKQTKLILFRTKEKLCVRVASETRGYLFVEAVYILLPDGDKVACWEEGKCINVGDKNSYVPIICNKKIADNEATYLQSNTLNLCFKLVDFRVYLTCSPQDVVEDQLSQAPMIPLETVGPEEPLRPLAVDFSTLLDNETLCDFNLKVGSKCIPVHKSILCARSPVFSAMLTSSMVESAQSVVDILDSTPDAVRNFVKFLYTDSVPALNMAGAIQLYELSNKYDVRCLRNHCSRVLASMLCPDSACRLMTLSDVHSDGSLKKRVITFIQENHREVLLSPEWAAFKREDPDLAFEVTESLILRNVE